MSGTTIAPALPALLAHFEGVPDAAFLTRLVLTVTSLSIAVCAPFAGYAIDRFGRRRLLIGAMVLYGLAGGSGAVAESLYAILAGRIILGAAVACVMTTAITLVGDYFEGEARIRYMGVHSASMFFGGIVFMTLGGAVAGLSWRAPFLIYLLAFAVLPAVVAYLPEPTRRRPAGPGAAPRIGLGGALLTVAVVYGVGLFSMIAFYVVPVQLPFLLAGFGVTDPFWIAMVIASGTVTGMPGAFIHARLRRWMGFPSIAAIGLLCVGAGFGLISGAESAVRVAGGVAIVGVGVGLLFPNGTLWLMHRTAPELRGRLAGGLSMSVFLGQFLSPVVLQPAIDRFPLADVVGGVGVAAVLVAAALFLMRSKVA